MMIWSSIFSGIIFIRHIIYITFRLSSLLSVESGFKRGGPFILCPMIIII